MYSFSNPQENPTKIHNVTDYTTYLRQILAHFPKNNSPIAYSS